MVVDWRQGGQRPRIDPVPVGGLTSWLNGGRNLAATQQVGVMLLGDSIGQGAKASNWYRNGWWGIVRDALAAQYGMAGEYVQAADNIVTASGIDAASVQAAWSATGGLGTAPMVGFSMNRAMAAADTVTFTPVQPFMDWDLLLTQQNGWSPFTLTLDGGAQVATIQEYINNSGVFTTAAAATLSFNSTAADADTNPHRWVRYRGWALPVGAATTHTLVLTASGGGGQVGLGGVLVYPKGRFAPGLVFTRHSVFGKKARDLGTSGWVGSFPNYTVYNASITDWQPAPSLCIIALGINDIVGGNGTNGLAYALDILAGRAVAKGASLVFVANYWATSANWRSQGVATISNIAAAYGAPFVDVHALLGSDALAAAYVTSAGDSHPTDAGHKLIAQAILSLINP